MFTFPPNAQQDRSAAIPLASLLHSGRGVPFALLDGAKIDGLAALLQSSNESFASLFVGTEARDLASVAPYLVLLTKGSRFAELLEQNWGRSCGLFLVSSAGLDPTRQHLQKQLITQAASGRTFYFRFYDPRVLRAFLDVSIEPEVRQFFGPVADCFLEADEPGVALRYTVRPSGLSKEYVPLRSV